MRGSRCLAATLIATSSARLPAGWPRGGPEAARLRAAVTRIISGSPPRKGGILAALRRSPLVGAELDLSRERVEGRDIEI